MIVIADGDVIKSEKNKSTGQMYPLGYDRYTNQQYGNKNFILNCVNYLMDDSGLITVRSRELKLRLLDRERIKTEEYLRNVIIYIHLNPVKHKFIENYLDYKYSSINALLSQKPTSLMRKEVIELFYNRENFIFQHNEMFLKGNYEDFE